MLPDKKINKFDIQESNVSEERSKLNGKSSNLIIDKIKNIKKINKELDYKRKYTEEKKMTNFLIKLEYNKSEINQVIGMSKLTKSINNTESNLDFKVKSKLKNTLDTSCPKNEKEYIPLNDNNLSFLDNGSILNNSKIEKSEKNKKINSNKEKMLEKNKLFEKEFINRKKPLFLSNALYKKQSQIINCTILLKNNKLYILNEPKNDPQSLNSEREIILINQNFGNNNDNNDISFIEENRIVLLEKRYDFSNPLFFINFDLVSCKLLINKKTKWIKIIILGHKQSLNIYIINKEKYDKFIYLLNETIFNSEGYKMNILELSLRKDPTFQRHNFMNLKEFESIAKTGDLLLFKSTFCGAKFQRLYTRDIYDHVALVERKNGILSIFQSSLNVGMNFILWDFLIDNSAYLHFDIITYRRLNIKEENEAEYQKKQKEIENKFEEFVKETKNKKYFLSFKNLIFCSGIEEEQLKGEWDKMEGFSCSSLVAAFYIKIGAIKYGKNIHSIKPGDFQSNKKVLIFNENFSLGPENIIEFSSSSSADQISFF